MKAEITRELLRDTKPGAKVFDIVDTKIKGFSVRVTPGGVMSYAISLTISGRCWSMTQSMY